MRWLSRLPFSHIERNHLFYKFLAMVLTHEQFNYIALDMSTIPIQNSCLFLAMSLRRFSTYYVLNYEDVAQCFSRYFQMISSPCTSKKRYQSGSILRISEEWSRIERRRLLYDNRLSWVYLTQNKKLLSDESEFYEIRRRFSFYPFF